MSISLPRTLIAAVAACVTAIASSTFAAQGPLLPIDICLTVGHPHPCVPFSDAEGDGWAIVEMAPGQSFPNFPNGTQFRVTGVYCTSCIQWLCGTFEGNIFQAVIHPSCVAGDVNGDGLANVDDLLAVIAGWGPCLPPCPADLNGDSVIDVGDLLIVITNWT